MTKVALLIGVSEYEPGLNPLPAAVRDVEALRKVLSDSDIGEFDEVKVLTNPDHQVMQYEIETLFQGRHKDDFLLLFFSGHGIKDDSNNLYFATRITRKNARGNLFRSTAVPARFIHEAMNDSRAKRQAIILDCCFSGAFDPALQAKDDGSVDLKNQLGAEGRVVLTSSSSTQYSFEQEGSELSLYTRYLVEGIETGAGDRNEDGKISMRELHEYATSKVFETAPNMTPKLITLKDMGLDIVLAKAKVTDPQLRYRRQVERCTKRGGISPIGRATLDQLRNQIDLDPKVAGKIEAEVLKPYKERLENLQRYRQAFSVALEQEFPLSIHSQSELEDLQKVLGLRQKDVAAITQEFSEQIAEKQEAKQLKHQESLQRYKQEFQKAIEAEYPLSEYVRDGLQKFQQSLGLQKEEIEFIERPIITKTEAEYQNNRKVLERRTTQGQSQSQIGNVAEFPNMARPVKSAPSRAHQFSQSTSSLSGFAPKKIILWISGSCFVIITLWLTISFEKAPTVDGQSKPQPESSISEPLQQLSVGDYIRVNTSLLVYARPEDAEQANAIPGLTLPGSIFQVISISSSSDLSRWIQMTLCSIPSRNTDNDGFGEIVDSDPRDNVDPDPGDNVDFEDYLLLVSPGLDGWAKEDQVNLSASSIDPLQLQKGACE